MRKGRKFKDKQKVQTDRTRNIMLEPYKVKISEELLKNL